MDGWLYVLVSAVVTGESYEAGAVTFRAIPVAGSFGLPGLVADHVTLLGD